MSRATRTVSRLLACWLLLTTMGCATLNLANIDLRSRKATARNPAIRVVCLWEPAEGRDPKGVPCQGFAGQILFLTNSSLPVSVDGDVRIYLFDNKGTEEEQSKPLHQFDFDGGSWAQHYTYGTLGPAYNVFVPYMRRGTYDATCALRVRLSPKHGPVIFSEMTSIELLGFEQGKRPASVPLTDSRVEQTTPEDLAAVNKRRRTTTIVLNSQNGVASDSADSLPGNKGSDQTQQAALQAAADVKPLTAADSRMAQLEQMVSELRAQQAQQERSVQQAAYATPARNPAAPPRRLEESQDPLRIRVRAVPTAPEEQDPAAKIPESDEPNSSFQPTSASAHSAPWTDSAVAGPAGEHRGRHPLDDDDDEPEFCARTAGSRPHPLANSDDRSVRSVGNAATAKNRPTPSQFRHPLAESEDGPPSEKIVRRKTIPASETPPSAGHERGDSFDPFDPIDTEAMETTAVQENPAVRRQLRAANQ